MRLFNHHFQDINAFLSRKHKEGKVNVFHHQGKPDWPVSEDRNLVLGQDTAVELGNPRDASTACLLWLNDPVLIAHRRVSVVGPDLPQLKGKRASFAKIVVVGGEDFTEDNCYQRYREMEQVRYDIHLQGYMMRGVSQYQREWSRISREAIDKGFSFQVLGGALIDKMSALKFVRSVEVIFVTSSREDVLQIKPVADNAMKIIGAMNKMASELSLDCDTCEYSEVCDDVAELRSMRQAFKAKEALAHG